MSTVPDFYSLMHPETELEEAPIPTATPRRSKAKAEPQNTPDFYSLFEAEPETAPQAIGQEEEEPDFYNMMKAEKEPRKPLFDAYRPEEKTPEELRAMSPKDKLAYAKELAQFRELQQSRDFTKGALSGLSLSASEHIPGLKPDEEDLMVGLGDIVGSYLPITGLYQALGKPLVQFAAKSPVAKRGLMSLARMTGFGLTGASYKVGKGFVQGERPTAEELGKEAAT